MIPWLPAAPVFPPLDAALTEPNGLLAAGGDLSPQRILAAYRSGIFPWYATGEPILWWSPDPRMVLFPDELKVSRSLAKTLRQQRYEVTLDRCFQQVIRHCAETPRRQQQGTWITSEMQAAYLHLHELGAAHSVEVWMDDTLAGGLYGLAIGRAFFGESMFAKRRDASKIALAHLCAHLQGQGFGIIDCQMETTHLASLGARAIPRDHFVTLIRRATTPDLFGKWHEDAAAGLYRQEPT